MSKIRIDNQGFTLMEVILVLAMLVLLLSLGLPFYQRYQNRNDLDLATISVAQNLRRAQSLARAVDANSAWGVAVQSGKIILFQGSSYASRNTNYDEVMNIPLSLIPSNITEIVFAKFTGLPLSSGTMTLTSETINEVKNITINSKGMADY